MAAALSFLTRVPIPARTPFSAADTGRSSYWFPLIGAMLGLIYALAVRILSPVLPCIVVAVIVIVIEALLTGALHLDGVADMADGFGGGRDRADVLRIMRDHAIGAYGATALILIILLKVTTISALCEHHLAEQYLIAGPALSRWATVLLSWLSPYARRSESEGVNAGGAVSDFIGRREFLLATLICAVVVGV
ncbi:MAG TPA: adenosylcobinamide-GDP ribazoletransferase, partial [Pirellulales bacterium]